LRRWHEADGWEARASREDREDNDAARASLGARLLPGADRMLAVLEQIALDPNMPAMARVKAAVEFCAMAGLVPPKVSIAAEAAAPGDGRTRVALRLSDLRQLEPEELAAFHATGAVPPRFRGEPPHRPIGS
jgi:hypothetical protein